uniref:Male-enhanced antigen 1-like n=1 Tax=Phallusia mammillata TaxID=59560 RepID=A0A6F9DL56_9ASCI|nr:male-enhanced antigen 1-like [Phallusia mammillata]
MNVSMPVESALVPEPEPKANKDDENELVNVQQFQFAVESSSEEEEDNDDNELQNAGYEPLSMVEAVDDAEHVSSDEEIVENSQEEQPQRELSVNTDLVKVAMKNIHLDEANIPAWAKDISDTAWDDFVKQTICKDSIDSNENTQQANSSSSSTT